jgi:hypothetical protein
VAYTGGPGANGRHGDPVHGVFSRVRRVPSRVRAELGALGATETPQRKIQVGPWAFDDRDGASMTFRAPILPKSLVDPVHTTLLQISDKLRKIIPTAKATQTTSPVMKMIAGWDSWSSGNRLFGTLYPNITLNDMWLNGTFPFVVTTHPVTGKRWGVFVKNIGASASSAGFTLVFREVPKDLLDKIKDFVGSILSKIFEFVCSGLPAASATAATSPTAAVAVVAGAALCSPGQTVVPMPPPVAPASSMLLPVLLVGGGLLAVLALTQD